MLKTLSSTVVVMKIIERGKKEEEKL